MSPGDGTWAIKWQTPLPDNVPHWSNKWFLNLTMRKSQEEKGSVTVKKWGHFVDSMLPGFSFTLCPLFSIVTQLW